MESPGTYCIYVVQKPNRYLQYLRSYRARKMWSWCQDSAGSMSRMCDLTQRCTSGESAEQISKAKCNSYSTREVKESWELHNPDRWSCKIRMHDRHQILYRTHQDTSPNISWKNESCSARIHKILCENPGSEMDPANLLHEGARFEDRVLCPNLLARVWTTV
jgi:hypothetical protein